VRRWVSSRRISFLLAIVTFGLSWACNAQPRAADMIADHVQVATTRPAAVATWATASGNEGRGCFSGPTMSSDELKSALDESIRRDHVFESVTGIDAADEVLSVDVSGIEDHMLTSQVVVSLVAKWSLFRRGDREAFWSETVATQGTAPSPELAPGEPVFRIAMERATKDNIAQGLGLLSRLPVLAAQSPRL
jgi:hypothetical protein